MFLLFFIALVAQPIMTNAMGQESTIAIDDLHRMTIQLTPSNEEKAEGKKLARKEFIKDCFVGTVLAGTTGFIVSPLLHHFMRENDLNFKFAATSALSCAAIGYFFKSRPANRNYWNTCYENYSPTNDGLQALKEQAATIDTDFVKQVIKLNDPQQIKTTTNRYYYQRPDKITYAVSVLEACLSLGKFGHRRISDILDFHQPLTTEQRTTLLCIKSKLNTLIYSNINDNHTLENKMKDLATSPEAREEKERFIQTQKEQALYQQQMQASQAQRELAEAQKNLAGAQLFETFFGKKEVHHYHY